MSFKNNLIDELTFQNIQYKEFAGKIQIPYSTLLSYIDSRENIPRVDIAYKIAQGLNVTVEFLITGKQEDNYKKNLSPTLRELATLPSNVISNIQGLIHSYYELYKSI